VQGGSGALFAVRVQILMNITSVAVQTISKPEISQGAGFKLRADERVWVQRPLRICLECRSISKKCDKQLTFIMVSSFLFFGQDIVHEITATIPENM